MDNKELIRKMLKINELQRLHTKATAFKQLKSNNKHDDPKKECKSGSSRTYEKIMKPPRTLFKFGVKAFFQTKIQPESSNFSNYNNPNIDIKIKYNKHIC